MKLRLAPAAEATEYDPRIPQPEDGAASELQALKARIEQLEAKLNRSDPEKTLREPLLATTTTDPSLLPRLPEAPTKPDEMKALAATSAPPQYATPSPRQAAPPQDALGSAPPAVRPKQQNGIRIPEPLQSPEPPPAV